MLEIINGLRDTGLTNLADQLTRLKSEADRDGNAINPGAMQCFHDFVTQNPDTARDGHLGFVGDEVWLEYRFGLHFSNGHGYAARREHGTLVACFDDSRHVTYIVNLHVGEQHYGSDRDRSCRADILLDQEDVKRFFEAFRRGKKNIQADAIDAAAREVVANTGSERAVVLDGTRLVVKPGTIHQMMVAGFSKDVDEKFDDINHEIRTALGYVGLTDPDR